MLVCDRFLFLHLHKSGGTFVNALIRHCQPGARAVGYHLPYSQAPEPTRRLPVLGTVRNPLGYYVSWYHFQRGLGDRRNPLFLLCSSNGADDFATTVERLVTLHERPALIVALADVFPDHFVGAGLNLTKDCIRGIAGTGRGFYSFLYYRLYAGAPDPVILKSETLREGLADYLVQHSPQTEGCWSDFLTRAPDMNVSRHGDVESYYPPALRVLVERSDATIFETHRY